MRISPVLVIVPIGCYVLGFITGILPLIAETNISNRKLEVCAETLNVYKCQFVVAPVKAPTTIIKEPELLPPPVKNSK